MKKIRDDTSDYAAFEAANDPILRRFEKIGTEEDISSLKRLIEEKGLSREDLELILRAIRAAG